MESKEILDDMLEDIVSDEIKERNIRHAEESAGKAQEDEESKEDMKKEDKKASKKEKKDKKDKQEEYIAELEDKVKRQMAEFDNFRKRTEKEKSTMYEIGARTIIEKILPVLDNFERGFGAISEEEKSTPFAEGMDKVYKQMVTELEQVGVTTIEAVGVEFNPERHHAVMQVDTEEFESGVVASELQKGYMYRDTVVRYSMVGVAN